MGLKSDFDTLSSLNMLNREIPDYIVKNLNPNFPLREYQKEAIIRFGYYIEGYAKRLMPSQLLFHMATGSGKTLIMASQILYLYEKGFRNFIFFVNSSNIIEKTKDNFLNPLSSKYLFAEKLKFGEKEVQIKQVDSFEAVNMNDINILFTTIQGLHSSLNFPRENAVTFEDFKDRKIVLLSDEAHHINTLTKSKLTSEEQLEVSSWEHTVNKIFKAHRENILLEFTATVDLEYPAIKAKYEDKIIYDYSLKQFRQDGYSKEVNVLQADISPLERSLQAVILSQYRRKIAEKNKVHLKPVILLKSKTIEESNRFEDLFHKSIKSLKSRNLEKLKNTTNIAILKNAFSYFEFHDISLDNLVKEIQEDFEEEKCLSINSKEDSEEKQLIVNSLEDRNNPIRVIFAVDKLNEGWDVLNLFDIVRLYETRDSGRTTIAEAQLIGRGARYFPFLFNDMSDKYVRKFDKDIENELRVLEELYYHSSYNVKYIQELRQALIQTGIIAKETKEIHVKIKENFKKTNFWQNGNIFLNKKILNERKQVYGIDDLNLTKRYKYRLLTGISKKSTIFDTNGSETTETETRFYKLKDFGYNVIQKAIHKLDFYSFDSLQKYFPHLLSIIDFINLDECLDSVEVEVTGGKGQLDKIDIEDRLHIVLFVLEKMSKEIKKGTTDYIGTKEFYSEPIATRIKDKTLNIYLDDAGSQEFGRSMKEASNSELVIDLSQKDWYIYNDNYGTSEEKYFVKFLNIAIESLKEKFSDVYLLKNERLFQIYRFSDGSPLEPDYVLFLRENKGQKSVCYQIFIEPKGEHLIPVDEWKEAFLKLIESEFKITTLFENSNFRLVGMPFFNETSNKKVFIEKFEDIVKLKIR